VELVGIDAATRLLDDPEAYAALAAASRGTWMD
jgi:hypothetical protein